MKRLWIGLFAFVVLFVTSAVAQRLGLGAGIMVGDPNGLSAKYWINPWMAVDAATSWTFGEGEDIGYLHSDFLIHQFDLIQVPEGKLPLYYGAGVRGLVGDEDRFGIRIPLGVEYLFDGVPADVFLELAPVYNIGPDSQIEWDGVIGFRYFFGPLGRSVLREP